MNRVASLAPGLAKSFHILRNEKTFLHGVLLESLTTAMFARGCSGLLVVQPRGDFLSVALVVEFKKPVQNDSPRRLAQRVPNSLPCLVKVVTQVEITPAVGSSHSVV